MTDTCNDCGVLAVRSRSTSINPEASAGARMTIAYELHLIRHLLEKVV